MVPLRLFQSPLPKFNGPGSDYNFVILQLLCKVIEFSAFQNVETSAYKLPFHEGEIFPKDSKMLSSKSCSCYSLFSDSLRLAFPMYDLICVFLTDDSFFGSVVALKVLLLN